MLAPGILLLMLVVSLSPVLLVSIAAMVDYPNHLVRMYSCMRMARRRRPTRSTAWFGRSIRFLRWIC
jgi:hypothetical protein